VALAAGVILLLPKGPPLGVVSATVNLTGDQTIGCDGTANVVGTVFTDGHAGRLDYQWIRSGQKAQPVLHIDVKDGQKTVTIKFPIVFSGKDNRTESVTLSVLKPRAVTANIPVKYVCN